MRRSLFFRMQMLRQLRNEANARLCALVAIFILACTTSGFSVASGVFTEGLPAYRVEADELLPVVDGMLDELEWEQARPLSGFRTLTEGDPKMGSTEVKAIYSEKGIVFGIRCEQESAPRAEVRDRDKDVWQDDCVEIFISTVINETVFYHIIVNAEGSIQDEISKDVGWNNSELRVKTSTDAKGWSAEIYMPFSSFGRDEAGGTDITETKTFGFNVLRTLVLEANKREIASLFPTTLEKVQDPSCIGLLFLEGTRRPDGLETSASSTPNAGNPPELTVHFTTKYSGEIPLKLNAEIVSISPPGAPQNNKATLAKGQSVTTSTEVSSGRGPLAMLLYKVLQNDELIDAWRFDIGAPRLSDQVFGHAIPEGDSLNAWWCRASYKVGLEQKRPESPSPATVSLARNEAESVQIVLSTPESLANTSFRLVDLPKDVRGEIRAAEYVSVTKPSDQFGAVQKYPDPLVPVDGSLNLEANRNYPIWLTFHTATGAIPGNYQTALIVSHKDREIAKIPVNLKIHRFALPNATSTPTAYGFFFQGVQDLLKWHGKLSADQADEVWQLYAKNLAAHRITGIISPKPVSEFASAGVRPFSPTKLSEKGVVAEIGVSGELAVGSMPKIDYEDFDQFSGFLYTQLKFTTLNFPWPAVPDSLGSFPRGSKEYLEIHKSLQGGIAQHLAGTPWAGKIYAYWVDEPSLEMLPFVREGMDLIKENMIGVRRPLTFAHMKSPVPQLIGSVDFWCPTTYLRLPGESAERRGAGDWDWWYVCAFPRYPYPNNFIDSPAINHRIHFWLMELYGVQGSLYWATEWWRGRNPWEDPMSYNETPAGPSPNGNGDGSLVYPPSRKPAEKPLVAGPINSIRMEMIRDGLEDREYFRLLEVADPALKSLLVGKAVESPIVYTTDPEVLEDLRGQIAERLDSEASVENALRDDAQVH